MSSGGKDLLVQVLFKGDASALPVRQFAGDLNAVEEAGGRVNTTLAGIGPVATAALATAGVAAATALGAALLDAADAAAKAERKVLEIGTLMGGLSKGQVRDMSDELGRLAITTGQSFDSLAKAKYDIVSSGFADAAQSAMVLDAASRLAVGGVADVGETGKVVTAILNAYGKSAGDAASVSDDLFTIVGKGVTTIPELAQHLGQLTAVAAPAGVSLDEVGASVATLTLQGQSTAIAVTSVSAAIMELSKPSTDLARALAAAGISSDNLIKSGHGLTGALQLLEQASERTGQPINRLIQREEALRAIMPLLSTGAQTYAADLAAMADNAGAADEAFRQMGGSADRLKGQTAQAFEMAKQKVGEAIIETEAYKDVLSGVKGLFIGIAEDADAAGVAMVNAANDSERRWIQVGQSIQQAFGWAVKLWDLADKGDKWLESLDKENSWNKLLQKIDAQQTPRRTVEQLYGLVDNPRMSDYYDGNAHKDNSAAVLKSTEAHTAHSAAVGRASKQTDELSAAAQSEALELAKAVEWYAKYTEEFPGQIQLMKEEAEGREAINSLLKAGAIDMTQYLAVEKKMYETYAFEEAQSQFLNVGVQQAGDATGLNATKTVNKLGDAAEALTSAGNILGGRIGGAFSSVGNGLSMLSVDTSQMTPDQIVANQIGGYAAIVSGVGQAVGGSVGNAISSAASMAAAGATIAGPWGAVIGGVVGLTTSILGGDKQGKAQHDSARRSGYDQMVQSALSGGTESLRLLQGAGWTYDATVGYTGMGAIAGKPAGARLLGERAEQGMQDLMDYLAVMDTAGQTLSEYMTPATLRDIQSAKTLLEYTIATVGDLGGVTEAYWAQVTKTVTGVSADSIAQTILDAIDNNSAAQAGEALVGQYDAAIKTSIRSMAVSQFVNDVAMELLAPVLQEMTTAMQSGTFTASSMAGYLATATSVMDQLSPMITALAQSFEMAGVSGYTPTLLASSYRSRTDYALALAGVPGYADGGSMDSGFKIVGERGWELMHTSPGRVISHDDSKAMLDNRQVVAQLEKLREENRIIGETLIKRVLDLEAHYDRWETRGLKTEAVV
jgi:hypothetical protein